MKIVLLPGLDGTGVLFQPLLSIIPKHINATVISLKQVAGGSYENQAIHIESSLGSDEVILVAESYSGMIALELVKRKKVNMKRVIFVASFISRPSNVSRIAKHIPVSVIANRLFPRRILGQLLFGKYSSDKLIDLFYSAIDSVTLNVLSWRLKQVSELNHQSEIFDTRCDYILPRHDSLISKQAVKQLQHCFPRLNIHEVAGTHFVLQVNPEECLKLIAEPSDG